MSELSKLNDPSERCPRCGAAEVASNTPRTTYACGTSDYDGRPGTLQADTRVAVKELCGWALTDSRVCLDDKRLSKLLAEDFAGNARCMLTSAECEAFICGGEDGAPPPELVAAFPKTSAYLGEVWL